MPLITLRNITLSYGPHPLLESINLTIEPKDRICIIGRNGAGKSSLLKLLSGKLTADSGEIESSSNIVITSLVQDIPTDLKGTIFDTVASGFGVAGDLVIEYEHVADQLEHDESPALFDRFQALQEKFEAHNAWGIKQQVEKILSKMNLNPKLNMADLSGGLVRRVLLARAIVNEPDLLLLDEPTNHLDIESIKWLEEFLLSYNKAILFITHDRSLLRKLATRIVEVDKGKLRSWESNYEDFLTHKAEQMEAEEKANQLFDKRLSEEERWIRQGVKARRTRNEGRVRRLEGMRREFQERRQEVGKVNMQAQKVELSGKVVFEMDDVSYAHDQLTIVKHFSTTIMRGDKIGIIGPNGVGKTTFLRLLLGELAPQQGRTKQGTNLEVGYFDQRREQLDESKTVVENISNGGEYVTINGKPVHVMKYLNDFLFLPERARSLTKVLSGGERHRLLLARMFTKPCNVLVLDEPTNDLDMETLELLEERLLEYPGTLLLVSHDREFLDNVVTSTLVFEGQGRIDEYVGGYEDYLRQRSPNASTNKAKTDKKEAVKSTAVNASKLSYKDKLELENLPKTIETLEKQIKSLQDNTLDPSFYKKNPEEIARINKQLQDFEAQLSQAYQRWEILDQPL